MRNKNKIISPTSCLETVVCGKNMKELFKNVAFEMCSLIAKPVNESKRKSMKITVTANNTEDLLMAFLKELLHYHLVRKILLCSCNVIFITENKIYAKLTCEEIGKHHSIINDIKSAKYGEANGATKIIKKRTRYETSIVFDVNTI